METKQEYFVFVSYQREDMKWVKWLIHDCLPLTLNGRNDLP